MKNKTGRGPKNKGRGYENEVRDSILATFKALEQDDVTCRAMGDSGVDLLLSKKAKEHLPLALELKRTERLQLTQAMQQAKSYITKGTYPAVVTRRNRDDSLVIMRWADLLQYLAELQGTIRFLQDELKKKRGAK
jgi:hypothetical protein